MEPSIVTYINDDLSLDLGRWRYDEMGVYRFAGEKIEKACSHGIFPIAILTNSESGEQSVQIQFKRSELSKWETLTVPLTVVADAKKIIGLAAFDISVTSGKRSQNLVDFLSETIDANFDELQKVQSIGRLGWVNNGFAPFVDNIQFDGGAQFKTIYEAIHASGSLDAWYDEIRSCRAFSLTTRLIIDASFASALIEPLHLLPFFVHLWSSESGTGKTVAQMCAASVWGNPKVGGAFFQTFKGTAVGYELTAGFLHSLPLILDELQLTHDNRGRINFNVYELCSGAGKVRGNKGLGVNKVPTWSNVFITSGETPITNDNDGAGALNRVLEIECKSINLCIEDGHRTAEILSKNYGAGGRVFLHKLLQDSNMDIAKQLYSDYYGGLLKLDTTGKQAMAAAVILTADKLVSDWLFGEVPLTVSDISEFLKSSATVSIGERGYQYLCAWVAENQQHFFEFSEGTKELVKYAIGDVYGRIYNGYATISRNAFARACTEGGFNEKSMLSYFKSRSLIAGRTDGRGYSVAQRITLTSPPGAMYRAENRIACGGLLYFRGTYPKTKNRTVKPTVQNCGIVGLWYHITHIYTCYILNIISTTIPQYHKYK